LARHDGKLTAAEEATLDAAELLEALRARAGSTPVERCAAIARYLSASDGWRDASRILGGAFAGAEPRPDGEQNGQELSGRKDA
jgi:hypothetical protein